MGELEGEDEGWMGRWAGGRQEGGRKSEGGLCGRCGWDEGEGTGSGGGVVEEWKGERCGVLVKRERDRGQVACMKETTTCMYSGMERRTRSGSNEEISELSSRPSSIERTQLTISGRNGSTHWDEPSVRRSRKHSCNAVSKRVHTDGRVAPPGRVSWRPEVTRTECSNHEQNG